MLSAFNSFQIVVGFAASPFLVAWLFSSADFPGVAAAKWVGAFAYLIYFCIIYLCVLTSVDKGV